MICLHILHIRLIIERAVSYSEGASPRPGLAGEESEGKLPDAPERAVGGAGARSLFSQLRPSQDATG